MCKLKQMGGIIIIILLQLTTLISYCEDTDKVKVLNNLIIDTEKKEIRIRCKLAITEGILEFFLVDVIGNTYESVFKAKDNKPSELHFGLLLLGFEPVPFKTYHDLLSIKDALTTLKNKKCLLQCTVQKDNKEVPLSSLIRSREADKDVKLIWVFTGASFTKDNKYTADYTANYMSIWPMPESVINLLSSAGNPYRGEYGYEMAGDIQFTVEDDFTLIIKEWDDEK
ncbi:MAG: hypothetical protein JXB88_04865 [Spirochaetales bacterium]|nr:hypothetical protein [Spirochaetales bacterium]